MAALVGYASSSGEEEEEEEVKQIISPKAPTTTITATAAKGENADIVGEDGAASKTDGATLSTPSQGSSAVIGPILQSAVPLGPSLPPMDEPEIVEPDSYEAPLSPYSANRAQLRDLTLPSVPNLDIPPSPPGSPPPGVNKKFEHFLELKKNGVHFNAKLEQKAALKNPSSMDKLTGFAELDEQSQYSTTLPSDLWDPNAFPEWAFRGKLRKSREKIAKEMETGKTGGGRTAIDFVPSTTPSSSSTLGAAGVGRGEKRKGGWK
ncbi:hypothetical protein G7046_g3418 [Stylonectria norvegica]|nr:hypothetical protein G7046_g3418 [Stylonectria norvegica]